MAGQVGSQIKVRVGGLWLLANVRDMRLENPDGDLIVANVDFLGEGIEDPITGNLKGFRRGVTRYPVPGTRVFPVTTTDLEQIFSAKDRPHRSEEHTSELQSLMRISYAVFCLKKKKK